MLARLLKQPNLLEQWTERRPEQRREALVLPFGRPKAATPKVEAWWERYPCTRMHGAAFEAEFYPAVDEQF
jgi:hypothetical protein